MCVIAIAAGSLLTCLLANVCGSKAKSVSGSSQSSICLVHCVLKTNLGSGAEWVLQDVGMLGMVLLQYLQKLLASDKPKFVELLDWSLVGGVDFFQFFSIIRRVCMHQL